MRTHFLAPTPRFGRGRNRLPIGHQQRSPYYWWWACLRRNTRYIECCESGGRGDLTHLYADFGDVRDDDFHRWWTEDARGSRLFAEQPLSVRFTELASATDWQPTWTKEDVIVLAVPMRVSKRTLKGLFNKLLDARHTGRQGRPNISAQESTARYKLARNYTIRNLQTAIHIYDEWLTNQQLPKPERRTLWQIGVDAGVNKQAAKDAISDNTHDRLAGRNLLGALVGRYVKQAKDMIEGTADGCFPKS